MEWRSRFHKKTGHSLSLKLYFVSQYFFSNQDNREGNIVFCVSAKLKFRFSSSTAQLAKNKEQF